MPDLFDAMMNATCAIYAPASGANDYGTPAQTWEANPVESNVPCRLSSLGPSKEMFGEQQVVTDINKVFMRPRAYKITPRMSLILNGDASVRYMVEGEPINPSGMNHHLELYVRTIQQESGS